MTKTYNVKTHGEGASYTVELDDEAGVISADGLDPASLDLLQYSVERHMKSHRMSAIRALGKSVGPYSFITEDSGDVSGPAPEAAVS